MRSINCKVISANNIIGTEDDIMWSSYISINRLFANHLGVRVGVSIRAYYDGSGKSNNPETQFLTLAGYAGTPEAWIEFEQRWSKVLQSWDCDYLHMQEARQLKGKFEGWDNDTVDRLLADLFNECFSPIGWENYKNQFYGASCTVNLEDYRKAYSEIPTLKKPEVICVDFVVTIALMALP